MEEVFSIEQLAEFLKIEVKSAQHLANTKRLPFFRVGRQIRFRRSAIEEWIRMTEISPNSYGSYSKAIVIRGKTQG
jgi:excisionase family DNA binding protein